MNRRSFIRGLLGVGAMGAVSALPREALPKEGDAKTEGRDFWESDPPMYPAGESQLYKRWSNPIALHVDTLKIVG